MATLSLCHLQGDRVVSSALSAGHSLQNLPGGAPFHLPTASGAHGAKSVLMGSLGPAPTLSLKLALIAESHDLWTPQWGNTEMLLRQRFFIWQDPCFCYAPKSRVLCTIYPFFSLLLFMYHLTEKNQHIFYIQQTLKKLFLKCSINHVFEPICILRAYIDDHLTCTM